MSPLRHLLYTVMCSVFLLDETDEARQNIALEKTVYQSTTYTSNGYNHTADLAVDTKFAGPRLHWCAITDFEYPAKGPWWEIDLGEAVRVGKVKVFGRIDSEVEGLFGFKMFVSETTPYKNSNSPYVYINNFTSQEYLANLGVIDVLFGDSPMRYVALALHRPRYQNVTLMIMMVCEVQIFMPCDDYHFEPDCAPCHCDEAPCNKSSGICPGGCTPGWMGQRCDQGDACDVVNGNCPRCCETRDCEAAVPKARVHLESVFIGGGAGLVLMALIVGIVLGVRHALRKRRSDSVNIAVGSDCKDQPVCAEQTNASDQCT